MKYMYPNELLLKSLNKISRPMKVAFLSCFIVGLLTHFYMLTNKLPNYDDVNCLTTYGTGIISGRFMLAILGKSIRVLFGNYSLPWLHGLIGIFLISLSASMTVYLLNIKQLFNCFLVGTLMIVSPAITGTFFFMFTVPYYAFSILLTVLSVWLVVQHPWGFIAAPVVLALSIGIYQAYLPFAAGLFLIILYQKLLNANEYKQILKLAARYLFVLVLGVILYVLLNKGAITLMGQRVTSYQGLEDMGKISPAEFPGLIITAFKNYFLFMFKDIKGMNPYPIVRLMMISLHLIICINIISSIRIINKRNKGKQAVWLTAGIIISMVLFPVAVNSIYIMANKSNVYSLMLYPTVLILLFVVMIMDLMQSGNINVQQFGFSIQVRMGLCWFGSCILIAISASQVYYANVQYLAIQMQYEQAYSYFVTMITQIKMTENYANDLPLVIIGDNINDPSFYKNSYFKYTLSGRTQTLVNIFSRNEFLKTYLGFNQKIEEEVTSWRDLPEVQSMPCYPNADAIRIVNGAIVLKLSN